MNGLGQRVRGRLVEVLRRRFVRTGRKRLEIQAILVAAGVIGFIASFLLLRFGMEQMWMRYPLAALVGWLGFLVIVRLWAEGERRQLCTDAGIDQLAVAAGNGAIPSAERGRPSRDSGWWDWLDGINPFDLADDGPGCLVVALLFIAVAVVIGLIVAIVGLVAGAELLLAEVVLDAVLVSALYRRLQHLETQWWLQSAMRQTIGPVLMAMLFLAGAGLLLQYLAPGADSIGDVWRVLR